MVDNIQGSEFFINRQIQQNKIDVLLNSKKMQSNNPYSNLPILDETDISNEALSLFEKANEIEHFKNILLNNKEEEAMSDKVALIKQQFDNGTFRLPSNDELAEALLGNSDFKTMMGF